MENRIGPDPSRGTLLLTRSDVTGLLDLRDCIAAVEDAFRLHATGKAGQPGVLGIHVDEGSFHIKAAALTPAQLRALCLVRKPRRIFAYDQDAGKASAFAATMSAELSIPVTQVAGLAEAVVASDIVITCTTATKFFITRDMVKPGTFIAAVGADNENKQEIDPQLLAHSTVVVDLLDQCSAIGDLHHAIDAGLMARGDVHAQLGEVVAGTKRGRARDDEITVFDSSGTALQDVAAAAAVYRRALAQQQGSNFSFDA